MRGHNICFYEELTKIIPNYHQILLVHCLLGASVLICSVITFINITGTDCPEATNIVNNIC